MNTVIGSRRASWLAWWACETCGLLYAPSVKTDPRIEQERLAEAEREAASRARFRAMFPDWAFHQMAPSNRSTADTSRSLAGEPVTALGPADAGDLNPSVDKPLDQEAR